MPYACLKLVTLLYLVYHMYLGLQSDQIQTISNQACHTYRYFSAILQAFKAKRKPYYRQSLKFYTSRHFCATGIRCGFNRTFDERHESRGYKFRLFVHLSFPLHTHQIVFYSPANSMRCRRAGVCQTSLLNLHSSALYCSFPYSLNTPRTKRRHKRKEGLCTQREFSILF